MDYQPLDKHLVIMADDFTGANDAGACLAEAGVKADVIFRFPYQGEAQALILNSDSRAASPAQAGRNVSSLLATIIDSHRPAWWFKKMDSTLRGNLGAEIDAMLRAAGAGLAIVAPAFPAAGRVTRGGLCWVNGQLLTDTEFATDPKTPVTDADIGALLQRQSTLDCRSITPDALYHEAARYLENPAGQRRVLVVDAQTDADLDSIIASAFRLNPRPLLVGSAGLCAAFSRAWTPVPRPTLLAIVGSMSEIAQTQLARLDDREHVSKVYINIPQLLSSGGGDYQRQICRELQRGRHCVAHTCPEHRARHQIDALCRRFNMTRAQLGETISALLGELTRNVLDNASPHALFLSGGDVAIAVANALGASGFHIQGQVAGCVPYGAFIGGSWRRRVMTKAGGFGDDDTLLQVLTFIEETWRD